MFHALRPLNQSEVAFTAAKGVLPVLALALHDLFALINESTWWCPGVVRFDVSSPLKPENLSPAANLTHLLQPVRPSTYE